MITFTTFDALTLEHNLRVDQTNRYGWQRVAAPTNRRTSGLGAVLSALIAFIFRDNSARTIEETSADDAALAAASHVQGAA